MIALSSLRVSGLSNCSWTSASTSLSRISSIKQRSPSRRRCRCARMRSAADERGLAAGGLVVISGNPSAPCQDHAPDLDRPTPVGLAGAA
jgi:hypothetical protein